MTTTSPHLPDSPLQSTNTLTPTSALPTATRKFVTLRLTYYSGYKRAFQLHDLEMHSRIMEKYVMNDHLLICDFSFGVVSISWRGLYIINYKMD